MVAGSNPLDDESVLAGLLSWITRHVLRYPIVMLVVAVAVALVSAAWTIGHLGFRTSRLDLLNQESGYNKLWIDYITEFGNQDDAVVVVEGRSRKEVISALEELSRVLSLKDNLFHAVLHKVDLSRIRGKGLHYLTIDELKQIELFQLRTDPITHGNWGLLNLGHMISDINHRLSSAARQRNKQEFSFAVNELSRIISSLVASLATPAQYRSPWYDMSDSVETFRQIDSEYLLANEGKLGIVLLRLAEGTDRFAHGANAIEELRRLIRQVQAQNGSVRIGLTGLPVMECDEMSGSQRDMLYSSIVSLVGVACLFIAGFGGLRLPLMTVGALLLALAWTFGFITMTIGHLNILSMSFAVILIGLGIDFGIHYLAQYLHLRSANHPCDEALIQTARRIGPGILIGGTTTAIAFLSAGFTDFTGIAELGIVAGSGIFLCVVACLFVLPAMIYMSDRLVPRVNLPEPMQMGKIIGPVFRFPLLLLIAGLAVCLVVSPGLRKLRYDHNLLNLQPTGLESVSLEQKLLKETDQSVWFALSIADNRQQLLDRKEAFLRLPSVNRTEEIVSLLPAENPQRCAMVARLGQRLAKLPERPPLIPETPPDRLRQHLAVAYKMVVRENSTSRGLCRQIVGIRDTLRQMPLADCYATLSDFQQRMAGDLLNRMYAIRSMAHPEPPSLSDLPSSLVTRFVGKNNRFLLKIYSRGDIWDMDALEQFVAEIKSIDPMATGKPLQTYYASRQMQSSYIEAAVYSLVAVVLILLLEFRRIQYVVMTLIPVGLGMLLLFGIMGLLDIPLNPANMIVLPLILGIGIDDGVHVVHDFRNQSGRYCLSNSTATAVIMTSLTTMVGFGSLMLASHLGLRSLGRVLTIGVSCCLFTSLVILPAILAWINRLHGGQIVEDGQDQLEIVSTERENVDPIRLHDQIYPQVTDLGDTEVETAARAA